MAHCWPAPFEDGIFRSVDRGSRWTACNFGLLDLQILALACSPTFAEDETAFAGAESGLYRSINGGRSWRDLEIPDALTPVLSVAVSPDYAGDSTLFIGTESRGLWRSRDSGQTWERIGEAAIDGSVNSIILAGDMLVLADDRLLISRNGGQTWGEWRAGLAAQGGVTAVSAPFGLSGDSSDAMLLVASVEGRVFWI